MNLVLTLGILLQVSSIINGDIELDCGTTSPNMPSSMTCRCKSTEGHGIEWRSDGTYTANCYFTISPSCSPIPTGYAFSSNNTELVFSMTVDPYNYSNCHPFSCIDVTNTSIQQIRKPSAIEFDSTMPTEFTEPGANHTNGNISITTNCISGYVDIVTEWYIIYNGSEKSYTPDSDTLITKNDKTSCTSCNSEAATSVTIGFTHTEAVGSNTQDVNFKLKVYHPSYPSPPLELTTRFVYAVKGDHVEDDDGRSCTCSLIVSLTLVGTWSILIIVSLVVCNIEGDNTFCLYGYFPFALLFLVFKAVVKSGKGGWKKFLATWVVDGSFLIAVTVVCKREVCSTYVYVIVAAAAAVLHIIILRIATCGQDCKKIVCQVKHSDETDTKAQRQNVHWSLQNPDETVTKPRRQKVHESLQIYLDEKTNELDEVIDFIMRNQMPNIKLAQCFTNCKACIADWRNGLGDKINLDKKMSDLDEQIDFIICNQNPSIQVAKCLTNCKAVIADWCNGVDNIKDLDQKMNELHNQMPSIQFAQCLTNCKAGIVDWSNEHGDVKALDMLVAMLNSCVDIIGHVPDVPVLEIMQEIQLNIKESYPRESDDEQRLLA